MGKLLWAAGSLLLAAGVALAQSAASDLRFDVASVKPAPPGVTGGEMDGGPLPIGPFNRGNHDPGRITWTNIALLRVIQVAYDFPMKQISGPGLLDTGHYNILATIPAGTDVAGFRSMLQNLLAERFGLVVHRETKQVSGYKLEIAKNGPKLKPSGGEPAAAKPAGSCGDTRPRANALMALDQTCFPIPRPGNPIYLPGAVFSATIAINGRRRATVLNETMAGIAAFLANTAEMPVEDQTGLPGKYDLRLEYVPRVPADPAAAGLPPAAATDPGPDLLDAVQQQLGLKLTPGKVPVDTLVVDRVNRVPSEN